MPYKTNKDLPETVANVLPAHAQDIYREAFNNSWQEYADPEKRRDDASREETAHKVAWSAVKKKYEKTGDTWTEKQGGSPQNCLTTGCAIFGPI